MWSADKDEVRDEAVRTSVKTSHRESPGGPVVENLPANAGDTDLIPGPWTKIPHATGQLKPMSLVREQPSHSSEEPSVLQQRASTIKKQRAHTYSSAGLNELPRILAIWCLSHLTNSLNHSKSSMVLKKTYQICRWHHPYGRERRRTKEPLDESEREEWKSWLKAQHSENKDHGIWSHHFMANRWGNSGNSNRLYFF